MKAVVAALLASVNVYAITPGDEFAWLVQPPPDRARVELRVTSVNAAGKREVAELTLRYACDGESARLEVTSRQRGRGRQEFCVRCGKAGVLRSCDPAIEAAAFSLEQPVPGTLLPWHVLTPALCGGLRVRSTTPAADGRHEIVELAPASGAAEAAPGLVLRVFVRATTQEPAYVQCVDAAGRERARVEILQMRPTQWGRAVTRWLYRDNASGARVLVEMRGGAVESRPSKPSAPDSKPAA